MIKGSKVTINFHIAPTRSMPANVNKKPSVSKKDKSDTSISGIIDYYRGGDDEEVNIMRVITEEATIPRQDGTRGSALYKVPFRLSNRPSRSWIRLFLHYWDHPPRYTMMHRPGIAQIYGDRLVLNGTTIEEIEKYHLETLKLVIQVVNQEIVRIREQKQQQEEEQRNKEKEHRLTVDEVARRLKFD